MSRRLTWKRRYLVWLCAIFMQMKEFKSETDQVQASPMRSLREDRGIKSGSEDSILSLFINL